MTKRASVSALGLTAGVLILYASGLTYSPPYLHEAEVLFALQAQAIATTAHDVNGRFLPLYFQMPPIGENVWFHPAIVYSTALVLKALPFTEWTIRFPSAAVGAINVMLLYFIARRIFRRESLAILAAVLLALTPAHFVNSRIAMDYVYPLPFVLGWALCLLIFLDNRRPSVLFTGTSLLGLGVYSYLASVVMMPLYLMFTWLMLYLTPDTRGRRGRLLLASAAGFGWPLLVLPVWLYFHPSVLGETLTRYGGPQADAALDVGGESLAVILEELRKPVRFSGVTGRISLYWYFFDPAFLFVTGGYANVVNSTRRVGVFLFPFLVFVPIGLWRVCSGWRSPANLLLIFGFFSAPLAACLVPEPYAIDREMAIVPFGVLIATAGLAWLLAGGRLRRAAAIGLLVLGALHFALFLVEYYGAYRAQSAYWFNRNHRGALEALVALADGEPAASLYLSNGTDPYMESYWRFTLIEQGRADLIGRTVYFDDATLDVDAVPAGSFVLATPDDRRLRALGDATLERVADLPEPADPPFFSILRRR